MAEHPAVVFLRAELDRVGQVARAAGGDAWSLAEHPSDTVAVYDSRREPVVYDEGWPSGDQAQHIALHDPAAVLRRVAADRQILAEHANDSGDCAACGRPSEETNSRGFAFFAEVPWPCRTVRLLAEAWGWTEDAS